VGDVTLQMRASPMQIRRANSAAGCRQRCRPRLSIPAETFWVIGHLGSPAPQLVEHLRKVTCTGHVPELASVLRPFDLHLIPWEHSTGVRTRVPLAFRHGQVVVAMRASVAGTPEACHQRNCWLVERREEMPEVINTLLRDPATRERLGRAARLTFERSFTRAAVLPIYRSVIAAVADTL
jgi:glycosyltransferase involved in cell wall biosynthesis